MNLKRKERVNVRLPSDLIRWAKKYARTHDMTFTSLVVTGLNLLYQRDSRRNSKNVEAPVHR
jgi:hypothetical protein